MEPLARVWQTLGGVAALLNSPSVSIYWVYLLSAAALSGVVYAVRASRGRGRSFRGLARYIFSPRVWWNRSVAHDAGLFVLNTLLHSFLFAVPLQSLSSGIATHVWSWLHAGIGPLASPWSGATLVVAATMLIFVVADFAFFIAHWAMHRIPVLWAFHKVHHSAPVLVPLTVFRRHPVDIVFEGAVSGVMLGVAYGVLGWGAGLIPTPYQILGVNVLLFVCLLVGFNLQHSHVWVSYGPLDAALISPAAHQIHHSTAKEHHDRNFGNMLSVWDRVWRTYVPPRSVRTRVSFGLGPSSAPPRSLLQLYVAPILEAAAIASGRKRKTRAPDRSTTEP